jgi:hypothetical protein
MERAEPASSKILKTYHVHLKAIMQNPEKKKKQIFHKCGTNLSRCYMKQNETARILYNNSITAGN